MKLVSMVFVAMISILPCLAMASSHQYSSPDGGCAENLTSREDLLKLLDRFLSLEKLEKIEADLVKFITEDPNMLQYMGKDFLQDPLAISGNPNAKFEETQLSLTATDQWALRSLILLFKNSVYFEFNDWRIFEFHVGAALNPQLEYFKHDNMLEEAEQPTSLETTTADNEFFIEVDSSPEIEEALQSMRNQHADLLQIFSEGRVHGLFYNHKKDILIDVTYRQFFKGMVSDDVFGSLPKVFIGSLAEYQKLLRDHLPETLVQVLMAAKAGGYSPEPSMRNTATLQEILENHADALARIPLNEELIEKSQRLSWLMMSPETGSKAMTAHTQELEENGQSQTTWTPSEYDGSYDDLLDEDFQFVDPDESYDPNKLN